MASEAACKPLPLVIEFFRREPFHPPAIPSPTSILSRWHLSELSLSFLITRHSIHQPSPQQSISNNPCPSTEHPISTALIIQLITFGKNDSTKSEKPSRTQLRAWKLPRPWTPAWTIPGEQPRAEKSQHPTHDPTQYPRGKVQNTQHQPIPSPTTELVQQTSDISIRIRCIFTPRLYNTSLRNTISPIKATSIKHPAKPIPRPVMSLPSPPPSMKPRQLFTLSIVSVHPCVIQPKRRKSCWLTAFSGVSWTRLWETDPRSSSYPSGLCKPVSVEVNPVASLFHQQNRHL